jgi:hypothetical protein
MKDKTVRNFGNLLTRRELQTDDSSHGVHSLLFRCRMRTVKLPLICKLGVFLCVVRRRVTTGLLSAYPELKYGCQNFDTNWLVWRSDVRDSVLPIKSGPNRAIRRRYLMFTARQCLRARKAKRCCNRTRSTEFHCLSSHLCARPIVVRRLPVTTPAYLLHVSAVVKVRSELTRTAITDANREKRSGSLNAEVEKCVDEK